MRRREFIAGLGSAAAWPALARAQQSALPVIGILAYGSLESRARRDNIEALLRSLADAGHFEGRSFISVAASIVLVGLTRYAIEFVQYALSDDYDRLPALAEELVRHHVATIIALTTPAAIAAAAATSSIPVVFRSGPTRSIPGSSQASTGLAAISLASSISRPKWRPNALSCCTNYLPPQKRKLCKLPPTDFPPYCLSYTPTLKNGWPLMMPPVVMV
jgi:hypothetical protein